MYRGFKIGVAVPAYNEEKFIAKTLEEMPEFVDRVYVVDDGSTDRTAEIVEEFSRRDPRIVLIRHERNQGVGAAIVSGWKKGLEEGMDILAVMSGDNQADPACLPLLLDPIVEGKTDFSKGTRFHDGAWKSMPKIRIFGTLILNILNKIASGYWHVNDPQNGYVAISAKALRKIELDKLYKGYAFENDFLIKCNFAGIRVVNIPVKVRYRKKDYSKMKISKFAVNTSYFLLKSFLWRIWVKYIKKGHPIGILYAIGFILVVTLPIHYLYLWSIDLFLLGSTTFIIACLLEKLGGERK